ncbi:cytochrome P450 [Streptomyces piniterrae]|uniref:Cytochrome P450 n=1 Tax=Streptomyces piniterrae TaxID=2571125 RepID=A0A4U0MU42_9ACTN|nr:cytochrome P450 [Streptomyces piniterrae]TJZ44510.1 cytochrome P450 [Streptomyces piniterrae]
MQQRPPARASVLETVLLGATVFVPTLAQGAILRRPRMVRLAARFDTHRRAHRTLARVRSRHGAGPVSVTVPGRRMLLLLSPQDARILFTATPAPLTPANREKAGALRHFEPDGVLISPAEVRPERRAFNETVLDRGAPAHRLFPVLTPRIREEAQALLALHHGSARPLDWDDFSAAFWRIIRRVVLGDAARDDHRITELLARLRADGNWLNLRRPKDRTRDAFLARVRAYVDSAEPGSLAALVAATPSTEATEPVGQVPHWLFAYDAASIATYSALALLASHPEQADRVRTELAGTDPAQPATADALPFLRACVLESLRLWPTSLAILRDTTADITWHNGTSTPADTCVVFYSSFFHRDDQHVPHADEFAPEAWLDGRNEDNWALAPFSHGPAKCPGQDLVLFTAATLLAALLRDHKALLLLPRRPLAPPVPLPRTIDHTSLRFALLPK